MHSGRLLQAVVSAVGIEIVTSIGTNEACGLVDVCTCERGILNSGMRKSLSTELQPER